MHRNSSSFLNSDIELKKSLRIQRRQFVSIQCAEWKANELIYLEYKLWSSALLFPCPLKKFN